MRVTLSAMAALMVLTGCATVTAMIGLQELGAIMTIIARTPPMADMTPADIIVKALDIERGY